MCAAEVTLWNSLLSAISIAICFFCPTAAVNSKGGKSFSDKVSGSDKKLTTKISLRNLFTGRLKSGVRGEDYSLNVHHLPLVQQRRKVR